jgi:hypothetical protein
MAKLTPNSAHTPKEQFRLAKNIPFWQIPHIGALT